MVEVRIGKKGSAGTARAANFVANGRISFPPSEMDSTVFHVVSPDYLKSDADSAAARTLRDGASTIEHLNRKLAAAAVALVAVALLACTVPAFRASRADPAVSLPYE